MEKQRNKFRLADGSAYVEYIITGFILLQYKQRSGAGLIITEGIAPSQTDWVMPTYPGSIASSRLKAGKR